MSKIKFTAKLNSKEDKLELTGFGIKTGNRITYLENNVKVIINVFTNRVQMERITDEYKVLLSFNLKDKEISTYKLKGYDEFFLNVETEGLFISDNCIKINYKLEDNEFSYILDMEEL